MLLSSACNIQLHDTTDQQHTSYVRGSIEVTEVNILVVSGATESFVSADFRMSVPALCKRPLNADFIVARAVNGQMRDTLATVTATLHPGSMFSMCLGGPHKQHFWDLTSLTSTMHYWTMLVVNYNYGTL